MISKELLEILVCPETKQPLRELSAEALSKLNASIESKALFDRSGKSVDVALDAALLREDGKVAYQVRRGIPILLVDEGIEVS